MRLDQGLMPLCHRAERFGVAQSAYMGVSIAKIGTGSQNKHAVRRRSEPLLFSVLLCWGTEPSEMVPKVCLMVHMGNASQI